MDGHSENLKPEEQHFVWLLETWNKEQEKAKGSPLNPAEIELNKRRVKERIELEGLVIKDPLTGIFNRRYMEEVIQSEVVEADRSGLPLGLAFIDLDHFKLVNDTYGHSAGDEVLRGFVRIVQGRMGKIGGKFGRYGGEEFVALFPNTPEEELREIITEIGQLVRLGTGFEGKIPQIQTISCGVSAKKPGETVGAWMKRVDGLNYEAKGGKTDGMGRNRMVLEKADGSKEIVKFG